MTNVTQGIKVTKNDLLSLTSELSKAIMKLTQKKISEDKANQIASVAINNIDFNNSVLAHKGINWYAKEILDMMEI